MPEVDLLQQSSPQAPGMSLTMDGFLSSIEKRAYRMAVLATKNHTEALDIVQEAMLKLVTRYSTHPAIEWGPLFHRILQRETIQWHRHQQRQHRWFWQSKNYHNDEDETELSDNPIENHSADENDLPDIIWQRAGQVEIVLTAIETLSLRQQQAFLLRAWEGYDVSTTASIMECSEGSVKTHYSRAVHELREQLQHEREDRR